MIREIRQWRQYVKITKSGNKAIRSLIHGYGEFNYYGYKKRNSVYEEEYGIYFFFLNDEDYKNVGATKPYYSSYMRNGRIIYGLLYGVNLDDMELNRLQYAF